MSETKVIQMKPQHSEPDQMQLTQQVKLVLNTSRGKVDISDCNNMAEIKKLLKVADVPKNELIKTMDYLKAKFKSGELVFFEREKCEVVSGEIPVK